MGRVKSLIIKKTAKKLFEENPTIWSDDFEHNKAVLAKMLEVDKKTRNAIAGYIVRLKKSTK